jgi:hypothetical protein
MNMTRRGFLGAMLAACAAPAIVRADNIMKVFVPPERGIILWGDGIHDDTGALEAFSAGESFEGVLRNGNYLISRTIIPKGSVVGKSMSHSQITMRNKIPQDHYMHFGAIKSTSIFGCHFAGMTHV